MKVIYVAGPYRHDTICGTLDNIRYAERVAKMLWRNGFIALCPHCNSRLFDDVADPKIFLNGYLELVTRCDAVVLIPGWEKSVGTKSEKRLAIARGIPVFEVPLHVTVAPPDHESVLYFMEELHAKC